MLTAMAWLLVCGIPTKHWMQDACLTAFAIMATIYVNG